MYDPVPCTSTTHTKDGGCRLLPHQLGERRKGGSAASQRPHVLHRAPRQGLDLLVAATMFSGLFSPSFSAAKWQGSSHTRTALRKFSTFFFPAAPGIVPRRVVTSVQLPPAARITNRDSRPELPRKSCAQSRFWDSLLRGAACCVSATLRSARQLFACASVASSC